LDDIVGLIVEQIVRSREAAERKRNASQTPPNPATAVTAPRLRTASAQPPRVAQRPVAATPAPTGSFAMPGDILGLPSSGIESDNPFGTSVFEDVSFASAAAKEPLLRAFAGGGALLAAFVLSEAFAPPIALREPRAS